MVRNPEPRVTNTGRKVVDFSIAVDKRIKPKDENEPSADFFRIIAWEKTADYVSNYLTKGRLVAVDGRLQHRKYTAQDGSSREVVEIVAENVQGLDRPRDDEGGGYRPDEGSRSGAQAPVPAEDSFDPFADE